MVMKAIVTLKERQGSSLPAVKKYISANYTVRRRVDHLEDIKHPFVVADHVSVPLSCCTGPAASHMQGC
jgi:hypothetical protein